MSKKVIISIILLLTYFLGFSHNIIPHTHDSKSEVHIAEGEEHHHHHHNKSNHHQKHIDHAQITHGNHFDEDLFDLLVCFLHTADDQSKDCDDHFYIPTEHNRILTNNQKVILLATLVTLSFKTVDVILISELFSIAELKATPPLIINSPLRGPPTFSC